MGRAKDVWARCFVSGLDPALPFFATLNDQWKLDTSDAEFVDVIHTGAGYFGKIEAVGHVDFYVNGGYIQPACKESACEYLHLELMTLLIQLQLHLTVSKVVNL